jgi:DNA-binding Xre family transcriptional regulator
VVHYPYIRARSENEVSAMPVSYKKLWKILIDKDMKKQDLQKATGISWSVITKLSKSETVSMEVLIKICRYLGCDIGDVMELLPEEDI